MVGCVLSQLKPSELYILSCEKGRGRRPRPFPQLRMQTSSGFILYTTPVQSSNLRIQIASYYGRMIASMKPIVVDNYYKMYVSISMKMSTSSCAQQ